MLISFVVAAVTLIANWRIFQKMGREGWEGLIPLYNTYVQFEVLYGNGARMFLLLIPFYNFYVAIKLYIDLAHAFNKSTGFGWGLVFLSVVFQCILAFGDAKYLDGSHAKVSNDAFSNALDNIASSVNGSSAQTAQTRDDFVNKSEYALKTLRELAELRDAGILTDEEFNEKKKDLLEMI